MTHYPASGPATGRPEPDIRFDWRLYRDATLAGLAVLVPVPLVDLAFEEFFRRRMPNVIAHRRGWELSPAVARELNQGQGCLLACLLLPFKLAWEFVVRLVGKLLYFLAIKVAADNVSRYWQRAFLIDYALVSGHLGDPASARLARWAMEQAMSGSAGPLRQVAGRLVRGVRGVFPTLRRARAEAPAAEGDALQPQRAQLSADWGDFEGFLRGLAARYTEAYAAAVVAAAGQPEPLA